MRIFPRSMCNTGTGSGALPAGIFTGAVKRLGRRSILAGMSTADAIYQAVKPLPESLAREVLDFVEFLRLRGQASDRDLMLSQQASLTNVWNNVDDEVWN